MWLLFCMGKHVPVNKSCGVIKTMYVSQHLSKHTSNRKEKLALQLPLFYGEMTKLFFSFLLYSLTFTFPPPSMYACQADQRELAHRGWGPGGFLRNNLCSYLSSIFTPRTLCAAAGVAMETSLSCREYQQDCKWW